VVSGRPLSGDTSLFYVDADNVAGGEMATELLLSSGHEVVATVAGPLDMCAGQDRLAGYRRALEARGQVYDELLVASGEFTTEGGYASMNRILARRPDVEAVFAASDLAAIGAIRALEERGRTVGRGAGDVAVVGFDDIRDAALQRPALTTIRQPVAELGATMSRRLLERLDGKKPPHGTVLPVELVERETA
jgi:DNA-binding LacI/PurR family transcriptional regulator